MAYFRCITDSPAMPVGSIVWAKVQIPKNSIKSKAIYSLFCLSQSLCLLISNYKCWRWFQRGCPQRQAQSSERFMSLEKIVESSLMLWQNRKEKAHTENSGTCQDVNGKWPICLCSTHSWKRREATICRCVSISNFACSVRACVCVQAWGYVCITFSRYKIINKLPYNVYARRQIIYMHLKLTSNMFISTNQKVYRWSFPQVGNM